MIADIVSCGMFSHLYVTFYVNIYNISHKIDS